MKNMVVASLLVVAIVAGAGAGYFTGVSSKQTTTNTTVLTMATAQFTTSRLYELVFNQTSLCGLQQTYVAPWAVTLNNKTTIVEPPWQSLPLPSSSFEFTPSLKTYSVIVFSVPNGSYDYVVYPQTLFEQKGTVVISGSNVVVLVEVNGMTIGCTATKQST